MKAFVKSPALKMALATVVCGLWVGTCAAEMMPATPTMPIDYQLNHVPAKPMAASLYQRLGGQGAIVAVVDDFVGNVAADKRINAQFNDIDMPKLKRLLVEQICAGSGGPCQYTGRDMKSAHAALGITGGDFTALVEDLIKSLDKFKVPAKEKGELLGLLGGMRGDIVTR